MNQRGFKTRRGLPFAKNSLYEILRNERYTGVYLYIKDTRKNPKGKYVRHGGEYDPNAVIRVPGGMPQIISEEDFNKVQEKMAERQHKVAKFSAESVRAHTRKFKKAKPDTLNVCFLQMYTSETSRA